MKTIFLFFMASITLTSCNEVKQQDTTVEKIAEAPKYQSIEVLIDGMTCEIGCARTIESKISKLKGVIYSKVDFESKKGVFTFDLNVTNPQIIMKKIAGIAGGDLYFPRDLKIYEKIVK